MNGRPAVVLDKSCVRAAFERAAAGYDAAAVLQRTIAERMLERLEVIRCVPQRVLDVGCGTGYCTTHLASRYPEASAVGLDLAHNMLRAAQRHAPHGAFVAGDAEALPLATASVDLLFSNLALQWCEPAAALAEFARVLRVEGVLMFSTFGPDTLQELRAAWRAADGAPHVHDFLDMHDIGDLLVHAGFADPVMDVERFTLTYADVSGVLRDLKALGAHNAAHGRARGLTGKGRFARFRAAYAALARDGRVPATYEVVYGHAWAPAPRAARAAGGTVSVPLERLGRLRR